MKRRLAQQVSALKLEHASEFQLNWTDLDEVELQSTIATFFVECTSMLINYGTKPVVLMQSHH